MRMYKLRPANEKDIEFLFDVSSRAMLPVKKANNPDFEQNFDEEFEEYAKKYDPYKIQVIQFKEKDIGRLRVVRSCKEIYVGGIQILPEYQNLGIGSAIFEDLIIEAKKLKKSIRLEVAKVNTKGVNFYKKAGFINVGEKGTDLTMVYEV